MISVNTDNFKKSIQQYRNKLEAGFRKGISEFFTNWAENILALTPVGDAALYSSYYKQRYRDYGWKPVEGMLIANWQVGVNKSSYGMSGFFAQERATYQTAKLADKTQRLLNNSTRFKMGDKINLWNATPYIRHISVRGTNGQELVNIEKDATDIIMALFRSTFKVEG